MVEKTVYSNLSGVTVGRYDVRERLGGGGTGDVYRAHDSTLGKDVALKRLNPYLQNDLNYRRSFDREAELGARLDHPHIVGVKEVFEDSNGFFLVMEYVEGTTLRERMQQGVPLRDLFSIARQSAEALEAAHSKNIVHRDIKPENIMLTPEGQVKVCDFGLAKLRPETTTAHDASGAVTGFFVGTPAYSAPEMVVRGRVDGRTDLFSLGVVLYELLTGQNPFRAESLNATNNRILREMPRPVRLFNPAVPSQLEALVMKLLAKDPADRYATAHEVIKDLNSIEASNVRRGFYTGAAIICVLVIVSIVLANIQTIVGPTNIQPPLPESKNLVVLPFTVSGGAANDEIYAKGLVEVLTARLTQASLSPGVQVTPATDVRARDVDSPTKARQEFGANLALTGALQFSESGVRLTYSLLDTAASKPLRSDSVVVPAGNPFIIQDQMAASVLHMMELQVDPTAKLPAQAVGTKSREAMTAYLLGVGYAAAFRQTENIDKAIGAFLDAIRFDPSFAEAHARVGHVYVEKFRTTRQPQWLLDAQRYCDDSVRLNAEIAETYICQGTVNAMTGQYEQAALHFERAIGLQPTNDRAYLELGSVQESRSNFDAAEQAYRKAIAARPHYATAYGWLGSFYTRQNRNEDAIKQFQQALKLSPEDGLAYKSLGLAYTNLGEIDEAIRVLIKGVNLRPHYDMYWNLGLAYMRARRLAEAIPIFEIAVRLGKDYRLTGNLARAYYWAGFREKAASAYERAIQEGEEELRVDPRNADAHLLLARYYAMLGRKPEALSRMEYALSARPGNTHYLVIAAGAYSQLGDRAAALSLLEKAVGLGLTQKEIDVEFEIQNLRNEPRFQALKPH